MRETQFSKEFIVDMIMKLKRYGNVMKRDEGVKNPRPHPNPRDQLTDLNKCAISLKQQASNTEISAFTKGVKVSLHSPSFAWLTPRRIDDRHAPYRKEGVALPLPPGCSHRSVQDWARESRYQGASPKNRRPHRCESGKPKK